MLGSSGGGSDPYEWLVVGAMINVALHPPNPEPEEYNSVHASGSPEVTVAQVLEDYAKYFLNWINRWAEDGFMPIGRQWQFRADEVGENIELELGDRRLSGTFVELDEQGKLVLRTPENVDVRYSVNEFFDLDRE